MCTGEEECTESPILPRKRRHSESEAEERTEVWPLKDLTFVDGGCGHGTVGRVVQVGRYLELVHRPSSGACF